MEAVDAGLVGGMEGVRHALMIKKQRHKVKTRADGNSGGGGRDDAVDNEVMIEGWDDIAIATADL